MTIEFADPGVDWTALIVTGSGLVLLLLAAAVFGALYALRGFRSGAGTVAQVLLVLAGFYAAFGVLLAGGLTTVSVYEDRVRWATTDALEAVGFSHIDYETSSGYGGTFTASREGDYFRGHLIDLEPAEGHAFQVVEIEGAE